MSKNQDYIAKIRYQNDLPPPLLAPKLIKQKVTEQEKVDSASLLTSLSRREAINNLITLDHDLGMSLDLLATPAIFTGENFVSTNARLHPKDRILLRDPNVDRSVKNQPNVSFLRRTEYIGSVKQSSVSSLQNSRSSTPQPSSSPAKINRPLDLKTIENTFEQASRTLKDLTLLKHPHKKHLKAKKVWSLLPDTSRLDQSFSTIRFQANTTNDVTKSEFKTAVFRKIRVDNDDWMGFYTADSESSKQVKRKLDDLTENVPIQEIDPNETRYKYMKKTDFDLKFARINGAFEDITLRFDKETGRVYYNPIFKRGELKKRKLLDNHREEFEEKNIDQLNIAIREPTVKELNKRNAIRHAHDSVTYELINDEE